MNETLLLIHILSAFVLVAAVVAQTAYVLGAPTNRRGVVLSDAMEGIGAMGVLILGIALALDADAYGVFDGWIIAAVVIWAMAGGLGSQSQKAMKQGVESLGAGAVAAIPMAGRAAAFHWAKVALVLALLAVMIYKPGA